MFLLLHVNEENEKTRKGSVKRKIFCQLYSSEHWNKVSLEIDSHYFISLKQITEPVGT